MRLKKVAASQYQGFLQRRFESLESREMVTVDVAQEASEGRFVRYLGAEEVDFAPRSTPPRQHAGVSMDSGH